MNSSTDRAPLPLIQGTGANGSDRGEPFLTGPSELVRQFALDARVLSSA